ncbi:MAG TPA: periplasmic heavy metal sensor [Hyphomonas sp.]|nr:periplasmic heavy metal sensor [Hyphomonas sp.]HRX72974.1 periplasmic heavy metal sensor [Hyphomonas sp.]
MNDKPASSRKIPFWLVISLMANMMLLGLLAGVLLRPKPPAPEFDRRHERFTWVPKEGTERDTIMNVLREAFKASEQPREARNAARKALADAVTKEPYDEQAVLDAFELLRSADDAVNTSTHREMARLFGGLTLEERTRMARFLMRGPRERELDGPGRRGGPDGPDRMRLGPPGSMPEPGPDAPPPELEP